MVRRAGATRARRTRRPGAADAPARPRRPARRATTRAPREPSRAEAREALAQAVAPVRQPWSALVLAAQHGVGRARGRTAELLRRDRSHPAVEAGFFEDCLREVGPRAVALGGEVPDPVR